MLNCNFSLVSPPPAVDVLKDKSAIRVENSRTVDEEGNANLFIFIDSKKSFNDNILNKKIITRTERLPPSPAILLLLHRLLP